MFENEQTNQSLNDDFLAGLESDDLSEDFEDEDTTADLEGTDEQTSEAELQQDGAQETGDSDAAGDENAEGEAAEMFPRTIRFLGEDRQISMDEAVTAIQKGLNYDRMIDKYKGQVANLQNDPRIAFVETLAQKAGVDVNTYITMQNNQGEYQSLIDEYGNIEAIPPAIMDKFNKYSQSAIEKAQADSKAAQEQAYLAKKETEYYEFMEKHPEFGGEVPQEVVALVSQGESLEGAFARHRLPAVEKELAQVKKDFEIFKSNTANKNSQMPDAKGGRKKESDDFLQGFLE